MSEDFRLRIRAFAERAISLAPRCTNEEGTKLFLILPFLNLIGYDDRDPDEVCPEHEADFSEKYKNRVDFAILKGGKPVIAIECKAVGTALKDDRGQLRSYFNAAQTVKMGVITDGLVYEFYADSDEPNMMDQKAFLTFSLRDVAKGKFEESVEEGIKGLQKAVFDPDNIGAEAKRKLIFQSLIQQIAALAAEPSEQFVRMLLISSGVTHIRSKALADYVDLTRSAFREFVSIRILQRLDLPTTTLDLEKPATSPPVINKQVVPATMSVVRSPASALELEVFNYVKKLLAKDSTEDAVPDVEFVDYHDYATKFVVFFKRERLGRLFDFYESGSKKYNFEFGEAGGSVNTDNLSEIAPLFQKAFAKRRRELA